MGVCGTTGLMMVDGGSGPTGFLVFLCLLVGAFSCIMAGARAFQRQAGYNWAFAGVVTTLLTASGLTLLCLPVALKMMDAWPGPIPVLEGNGNCCGILLVFPSAVIIVCGLIGGVKGLLALMRPGTRELFDRQGD